MGSIRATLGLASIVLALAACDSDKPKVKNFWNEYNQAAQQKFAQAEAVPKPKEFEQTQFLEGRIIAVQPRQFSYNGNIRKNGEGYICDSSNRQFAYVIVEDRDNAQHTLIHPLPGAILERDAMIEFWQLYSGGMRVQTFIKRFMNPGFTTNDNVFLGANGVITPDGIEYK